MAFHFDEISGDNVQITDHAALTLPDGDWTIAGWIRWPDHTGSAYQWHFSWGAHGGEPSLGWYMSETTAKLHVWSEDAGGDRITITSSSTPAENTAWQHLILQRSGNTVTQYVNGVADGADTNASYGAINVASNLFFGRLSSGGNRLGGDLAEWGKWDRALNAGERAALAARFSPACIPGRKWHVAMIREYQELVVPLVVTNGGSTVVSHPPIIYPLSPKAILAKYVGSGGRVRAEQIGLGLRRYIIDWLSDTKGVCELWLCGYEYPQLQGVIDRIVTVPSNTQVPTHHYDIDLETVRGVDILDGRGHDRHSFVVETSRPYHALGTSGHGELVARGDLVFKISGAGGLKRGQTIFYLLDA